jgi:hypothetical protein
MKLHILLLDILDAGCVVETAADESDDAVDEMDDESVAEDCANRLQMTLLIGS